MALTIRRRFNLPLIGPLSLPANFSIYNTESAGPVHDALASHPGYVCSEYFGPRYCGGEIVRGIRHEDLQHLSLPNNTFDLVLSSDVLEHVPDPYAAHREIFRVLRPGGRHIFTVPFDPDLPVDDVRARLIGKRIEYLAPAQYHGDPINPERGILVWTIFGQEMLPKIEAIGFEMRSWLLVAPEHGIIGDGNIIFEAMKPGE